MKLWRLGILGIFVLTLLPAQSKHGDKAWRITQNALFNSSQFCARNQDACALPSAVWGTLKDKASFALSMFGSTSSSNLKTMAHTDGQNAAPTKARFDTELRSRPENRTSAQSQNTLTKSDLQPRWDLS